MPTPRREPVHGASSPVNCTPLPDTPLVLIGGGGHGVVVGEAATLAGWKVAGFVDDSADAPAGALYTHVGRMNESNRPSDARWILCVGDVEVRRRLLAPLASQVVDAATIIHPAAFISPTAVLGKGVFIGPGAIVHAGAVVGDHAIINTGAIVEHHCVVGENTHIAPGAVLAGACRVGTDSLIGVGARVLPRITVGNRVTVGAGGVVIDDVPHGRTVKGVPAR